MRTLIFAGMAILLSAYTDDPGDSGDLRITNGVQYQPQRLSAIISQDGCTGTFVSPTTIITAAHCADHGFTFKGVKTRSYQSMPEYLGIPWDWKNDVRVLIFPQPVAPAWMPVVNEPVFPGLHVVLAGFGRYDDINGRHDGRFRFGTNIVSGLENNGHHITIEGTRFEKIDGAEGTQSTTGPGDSGGPLLWNGRLAGTLYGGSAIGPSLKKSYFMNLTHPEVRAFLNAQIARNGADIRFSDQGSVPYQECVNLDPNQRVFTFVFDVPHSNISSMAGEGGAHLRVYRKKDANRNSNSYLLDNDMNGDFYTFSVPSFGAHLIVQDGQPTPRFVCFI